MLSLDFLESINTFLEPIFNFFKEIWNNIQGFLVQYMPEDVVNVLIYGIIVAIILIIVLAVINKRE